MSCLITMQGFVVSVLLFFGALMVRCLNVFMLSSLSNVVVSRLFGISTSWCEVDESMNLKDIDISLLFCTWITIAWCLNVCWTEEGKLRSRQRLDKLRKLDCQTRTDIMQTCLTFSHNESVNHRILKACAMKSVIEYSNIADEFSIIAYGINRHSTLADPLMKELSIEVIKSVASNNFSFILNRVDYTLLLWDGITVICLKNTNAHYKIGTSAVVEMTDVNMYLNMIESNIENALLKKGVLSCIIAILVISILM